MKLKSIREACSEANKRLASLGLVDLTFGNLSLLDRDAGIFAIKPSGVPYSELTAETMVLVSLEGKIVEGKHRPSSDTPTHRALLQAFEDVNSVVHTHSRHAVAFAQAERDIPCLGTTHADYFHGPVPVTRELRAEEIEGEYEWETGRVILESFRDRPPLDCPSVLVRHHGPFSWGDSADKALESAQALEIIAEMAWKALSLGSSGKSIPAALLQKHFFRKHGPGAYYGQPAK